MATKIEWTQSDDGALGETWNPLAGCTPISPGCAHCYAATMARRLEAMGHAKYAGTAERRGSVDVFTGRINFDPDALSIPLKWRKPRRVFVNSMSDLFHESVPFEFVDRVFAVMNATSLRLPWGEEPARLHTYQVLTKRPERMAEYMLSRHPTRFAPGSLAAGRGEDGVLRGHGSALMNAGASIVYPPTNVWLGTSVEDQKRADERIPHLLRCPAAVRFLSCEPLLGPISFKPIDVRQEPGGYDSLNPLTGGVWGPRAVCGSSDRRIDWIIAGGESGTNARPCEVAWIRSIVTQCKTAGVPLFVKQVGAYVVDRNDAGFDAYSEVWAEGPDEGQPTNPEAWPDPVDVEHDLDGTRDGYQGAPVRVRLRDKKGGDPAEWPVDLRVREFPEVRA